MSSSGHKAATGRGALFYCILAVAVLLVIRPIVAALGAPLPVRLLLGIALVLVLFAVAGLLVARRLQGDIAGPPAYSVLFFVAMVLVSFAVLVRAQNPSATGAIVFVWAAIGVVVYGLHASRT
jgi:ABC-type transport system involved in cytochrome c biogenesis permease subunit